MTNIRRIAHTPAEAECIARLLLMQVILVCVAHAAQRSQTARGMASGCDPSGAGAPEETDGSAAFLAGLCGDDPAVSPGILRCMVEELIAGTRMYCLHPPPALFLCGRTRVLHMPGN